MNAVEKKIGVKVLLALAVGMVATSQASAQANSQFQPKLVVGIMVDDLRSEYVSLLKDHFSDGGFNRLLNNGVVITNADFGANVDPTAATAIIYTGAAPAVNGIPAEEIFDRATQRGVSVFSDEDYIGNSTNQKLSPKALTVTNIADEVRIAGGGVTYSYAIAPDPSKAMIMAGHASNCGLWLNDANQGWATTTFYKDPPSTLTTRNRFHPLKSRIDTMVWQPLYPAQNYPMLPPHVTAYPFKHSFKKLGAKDLSAFRNSPKVNDEVTAFAIENIDALKLGKHSGPDMISIAYTVEPYRFSTSAENRYELYDSYYRLDKNLETLFREIDRKVGLDSTLVFLAATPPSQRTRREDENWQLPYGEFSTRKALSLLNLYLMAKHGNGAWATAYHNGQVFLNHRLIDQQGVDAEDIRLDAARFLEKMSGVYRAYSLEEIIDGSSSETEKIRQNTSLRNAGDVWITVMPGWQIIDDDLKQQERTEQVERPSAPMAPVYILAPNIEAQKIDTPVDARSIAPTITTLLRIRSPNAAILAPVPLKEKGSISKSK